MKRLIIICEGSTEQEFCKDVLFDYFLSKEIVIETPLIKKSNGGIVAWKHLKKQIELHLNQDTSAYVTTLIDLYGISQKLQFPAWDESKRIIDKNARMDFLETSMKNEIIDGIRFRFLPYLQLHEFEGLLFNNITAFKEQIPEDEFNDINQLNEVIAAYPNPELINDSPLTAPSKRLGNLIKGYNKPVYGSIIAEAIGLQKIRAKCPRFNEWITKLESI